MRKSGFFKQHGTVAPRTSAISKLLEIELELLPLVDSAEVFTLTATDPGPGTALDVAVIDTPPARPSFICISATPGIGLVSQVASVITWNIGSLLAGQTSSLDLSALVTSFAFFTNSAPIAGGEPDQNRGNN